MTPAVKLLEQNKTPHFIHHYQHSDSAKSYGLEAAEKMSVSANRIFKTLVIEYDDKLAVCIVPVEQQLSLKLAAKALKAKKAQMAVAQKVEKTTGYVLGGVSPLGQKKQLPTLIDTTASSFDTIFISGGKRGLEIELAPDALLKLTNAEFCTLS
ncbi:Cys-tRNA(Pro) deacylase [Thalassotalea piscium]|uniref:Cys-tRNA(Pro)/Cys-tRNA(Cys) deacylase n=1 Tax=Thalassotalea piscium TaxID=1230533 RepID=A0A7X0TSI1_9GAMM|nr:Cys-tRNA(Pro) deacylase [Thalassotalea piscium]MBB6542159.1 Cys-tRNA(Pro)/Cys-tRNA(Cys) deacylase [Thalassotalea piscium]